MAAANQKASDYEDIDEAEEEALLKSDDEIDLNRVVNVRQLPPPNVEYKDSLMTELMQEKKVGIANNDTIVLSDEDDDDDEEKNGDDDNDRDNEDDDDDDVEDDDDDDDDDDDELEPILKEFNDILKELQKNQYAYDKYVRLCEISHATEDLDNIRLAYKTFASVYPLSPDLWLKYLCIEMSVATSPNEIKNVEELFRKALGDYYSTDIALQFAFLAPQCAEPEDIWQELLGTYGLHCTKGEEFFKRYRQYIASHKEKSNEEKQDSYIQSFLRELRYPMSNMTESYIEFKVFYEKNKVELLQKLNWEKIDREYFKAKEHLELILPFEEKLDALDPKCYRERAEVYTNYIKEADKFLDENILQTLYERMVADCCLSDQCWLTYIDFIDYRDEFERPEEIYNLPVFQQSAIDINNRALRNCTWSDKLYIKRIHLLEKAKNSREEIQEVLESSLSAGFQTAEPVVAIWLEYLAYLRRHTDWQDEGECDILRKNFNLCWTILGQQWGVLADCNCEILQLWGRLEYGPLQDPKRGKELWTTVMESSDNSTKSGLWIEFIQLELRHDLSGTRKLYRKALQTNGLDNPLVIVSAWQRFERCNGTLESLSSCIKECTVFQLRYLDYSKIDDGSNTKSNKNIANKAAKRKHTNSNTDVSPEKKIKKDQQDRKLPTSNPIKPKHVEFTFKEHENQEIDLEKDHLRIFLSNLDYNLTPDEIRVALPELKIVNIDLICSANGRSRGFGYLELDGKAEVEKALSLDRRSISGRPVYISSVLRDKEKRQKFKYSDGLEPKKLFVKGLPHDTKKEELEEIFDAFGKLKDVRLVYHKSGKFKSIAYVEFENKDSAHKAVLTADGMNLRGHMLTVAISAPPPKSNAPLISTSKLLGVNIKRQKVFDQKPRMSLIPTSVRKNIATDSAVPLPPNPISDVQPKSVATSSKTNEDFRKLLLK